jgi:hypothetical protein
MEKNSINTNNNENNDKKIITSLNHIQKIQILVKKESSLKQLCKFILLIKNLIF